MENKQQIDRALQAPQEANRDKHINFLAEERGDADVENENKSDNEHEQKSGATTRGGPDTIVELPKKEIRIEPVNEQNQRTDADDKIFDDDVDRSPTYLAEDDVPDTNTEGE